MPHSRPNVTELLVQWSGGDEAALGTLMPLVYDELHRMPKRYMSRQNPGHTLQTTALIHEAYVRLIGQQEKRWQNRAHFYAVAAQAMRHVLVYYARSRRYAKRGGGLRPVSLDEAPPVSRDWAGELIALDEALTELSTLHPRQSRVVELKYFGGLSVEETANSLRVSPETVMRDWKMAKAWLRKAVKSEK